MSTTTTDTRSAPTAGARVATNAGVAVTLLLCALTGPFAHFWIVDFQVAGSVADATAYLQGTLAVGLVAALLLALGSVVVHVLGTARWVSVLLAVLVVGLVVLAVQTGSHIATAEAGEPFTDWFEGALVMFAPTYPLMILALGCGAATLLRRG